MSTSSACDGSFHNKLTWGSLQFAVFALALCGHATALAETFGYNSIYGTSQSGVRHTQIATQVQLPTAGTISSITAYVGGQNGQSVRYAIYTDSSGEPDTLLAQSANSNTSSTLAWKTLSVTNTYLPAANYWLVLSFAHNNHVYRYNNSGGVSRVKNNNAVSNGFLATWGTSTSSGSRQISIYATYTPYVGQTYYVRKTGNNSNNGKSPAQAFLTIGKAASTMLSGDSVYVGAGTYTEQILPGVTGSSSNKIKYLADTSGTHTGDAGIVTITANNLDVLLLNGRNYTEFHNFVITATGSGRGARWQNSTNGILNGCTIRSTTADAVSLSQGSLTVQSCILKDSGADGIDLDTNGLLTMADTTVSGNAAYGVNANNTGCTLNIRRCIIQDNTSHGIYIDLATGSIINCLVLGNNNGLHVVSTAGSGINVWNSTFVANDTDGIQTNGGTINVRNCIAANNGDEGFDCNSGTFTHSYNLSHGNGDNNYEGITKAGSELEVDPQFAGSADYRLVVGSPAINTGTNAAGTVDDDLNGNDRPLGANWDMGCYEDPVTPPSYEDLVDGYSSNGPIAWWRMNDGSNATVADDEMNLNDGIYQGPATGVATPQFGATNESATFDGVNDYVSAGTFNVSGSALTMLAWFHAEDFAVADASILSKATGTAESNHFWMLGTVDSGGIKRLRYRLRTGTTTTTFTATSGTLVAGTWHFAAAVYDGANMVLYLDGVQVGSTAKTGTLATNASASVWVGNNPPSSTSRPFHGQIDEVAIFDKALTSQQIAAIYDASFEGIYKGLVGYWKLNETSGTVVADSSTKGNQGTRTGGAWSTDGKADGALELDGSTTYVAVTNKSSLQLTSQLTAAGWIRGDNWGSGSDADTIIRKGEANPNNYQLAITDGRVSLTLDGNDGAGYRGNTVLQTGQWYHVAATWDGAVVIVYLNGVMDHASPFARTGTIGTDSRALYLGGRAGADLFDGFLDELRLYNRALTQEEILALLSAGGSSGGLRVMKWVEIK